MWWCSPCMCAAGSGVSDVCVAKDFAGHAMMVLTNVLILPCVPCCHDCNQSMCVLWEACLQRMCCGYGYPWRHLAGSAGDVVPRSGKEACLAPQCTFFVTVHSSDDLPCPLSRSCCCFCSNPGGAPLPVFPLLWVWQIHLAGIRLPVVTP